MVRIITTLIERLVGKGIEINTIPAYIRDLANILAMNSHLTLEEFNGRLRSLGWDDFELDDHTLQLVLANFETDGPMSSDKGKVRWFENHSE